MTWFAHSSRSGTSHRKLNSGQRSSKVNLDEPQFTNEVGSSGNGHRLDIRISRMNGERYTTFWAESVIQGRTIAEAFMLAGYGGGALRALDFYSSGDDRNYRWVPESREWVATPSSQTSAMEVPR